MRGKCGQREINLVLIRSYCLCPRFSAFLASIRLPETANILSPSFACLWSQQAEGATRPTALQECLKRQAGVVRNVPKAQSSRPTRTLERCRREPECLTAGIAQSYRSRRLAAAPLAPETETRLLESALRAPDSGSSHLPPSAFLFAPTFCGTHYADPRQIWWAVLYRFHF